MERAGPHSCPCDLTEISSQERKQPSELTEGLSPTPPAFKKRFSVLLSLSQLLPSNTLTDLWSPNLCISNFHMQHFFLSYFFLWWHCESYYQSCYFPRIHTPLLPTTMNSSLVVFFFSFLHIFLFFQTCLTYINFHTSWFLFPPTLPPPDCLNPS